MNERMIKITNFLCKQIIIDEYLFLCAVSHDGIAFCCRQLLLPIQPFQFDTINSKTDLPSTTNVNCIGFWVKRNDCFQSRENLRRLHDNYASIP